MTQYVLLPEPVPSSYSTGLLVGSEDMWIGVKESIIEPERDSYAANLERVCWLGTDSTDGLDFILSLRTFPANVR